MSKLPKVTKKNYYDAETNKAYWSASQVKEFLNCPAKAVAVLNGEWEDADNTALLVGGYVDAWFEGTKAFNAWCGEHPQIFKKDGSLKAEYIQADNMISRAIADPLFTEYMKGRKQVIKTGKLFGLPFKCKYDAYNKKAHRITDLKTARDLEPKYKPGEGKLTTPEYWRWDLQMAIYAAIEGNDLDTFLAVVTKQNPPDIAVIDVDRARREANLNWLEPMMKEFNAMKVGIIPPTRCEKCEYCRASKRLAKPITIDELEFETLQEGEV